MPVIIVRNHNRVSIFKKWLQFPMVVNQIFFSISRMGHWLNQNKSKIYLDHVKLLI